MFSIAWGFLSGWFRKLAGYLVVAGFFILALLGIWLAGRNSGKNEEEAENEREKMKEIEAANDRRVSDLEAARDVKEEVNRLDPGAAADKLRDKWSRD